MSSSCDTKAASSSPSPDKLPLLFDEAEKAAVIEQLRERYKAAGVEPTDEQLESDWEFMRDF